LFDADRAALQRIAAASKVVPVPIMAKLGEGAFGPLLCARVAGMLDPSRAVDVAKRLPPPFLADVAISIDPRRASEVIAQMPVENILAIARELLARGEFVAVGRFVGYLSDPSLEASVDMIDPASLLRIAFVVEGKERLDEIIEMLSEERLEALIRAADEEQLWPEALDVLSNLNERNLARLAELAAAQDEAQLDGLIEAARREGMEDLVPPALRQRPQV
jgi:hypothetical protein